MYFRTKALLTISCALALATSIGAQAVAPPPPAGDGPAPAALKMETYRLWPGRAPGAKSDAVEETPTVTLIRPQGGFGNGTAVVLAPGGAYIGLATMLEGVEPAAWFTSRGVTVFLLTYRVGPTARLPIPFADGARAVRFVRSHAAQFGVDPGRIGMMGFSAGGHLAATTAVDAKAGDSAASDPVERVSSRPDFLILGYPWIEGMQVRPDGTSSYCDFANRRGGGAPCNPKEFAQYLPTLHVDASAPPTFIYHTTSDALVPVAGSVRFYQALVDHGVPAEMHLFQTGAHGSGLGGRSPALALWPDLLDQWLRARQLLGPLTPPVPTTPAPGKP